MNQFIHWKTVYQVLIIEVVFEVRRYSAGIGTPSILQFRHGHKWSWINLTFLHIRLFPPSRPWVVPMCYNNCKQRTRLNKICVYSIPVVAERYQTSNRYEYFNVQSRGFQSSWDCKISYRVMARHWCQMSGIASPILLTPLFVQQPVRWNNNETSKLRIHFCGHFISLRDVEISFTLFVCFITQSFLTY